MKNRFSFSGNVVSAPATKSFKASGETKTYVGVKVAANHPRSKTEKALFIEVQMWDKFSSELALQLEVGERVSVEGELSWDTGNSQTFWKLGNASFAPGWLPPRKDGRAAPSRPADVKRDEPDTGGVDDETDLPF